MFKRYSYDDEFTYVCDPLVWKGENINRTNIKQAQLFCTRCSIKVNITQENMITLPVSLITLPADKITFEHCPIYGGQCLRPECGKKSNV